METVQQTEGPLFHLEFNLASSIAEQPLQNRLEHAAYKISPEH